MQMDVENDPGSQSANPNSDNEKPTAPIRWEDEPSNAMNWSSAQKTILMIMTSSTAFVAYV